MSVSFTIKRAADASCIGQHVITDAIRRGDLIAHYIGVKAIIRAADLDSWIETLPTERPDAAPSG